MKTFDLSQKFLLFKNQPKSFWDRVINYIGFTNNHLIEALNLPISEWSKSPNSDLTLEQQMVIADIIFDTSIISTIDRSGFKFIEELQIALWGKPKYYLNYYNDLYTAYKLLQRNGLLKEDILQNLPLIFDYLPLKYAYITIAIHKLLPLNTVLLDKIHKEIVPFYKVIHRLNELNILPHDMSIRQEFCMIMLSGYMSFNQIYDHLVELHALNITPAIMILKILAREQVQLKELSSNFAKLQYHGALTNSVLDCLVKRSLLTSLSFIVESIITLRKAQIDLTDDILNLLSMQNILTSFNHRSTTDLIITLNRAGLNHLIKDINKICDSPFILAKPAQALAKENILNEFNFKLLLNKQNPKAWVETVLIAPKYAERILQSEVNPYVIQYRLNKLDAEHIESNIDSLLSNTEEDMDEFIFRMNQCEKFFVFSQPKVENKIDKVDEQSTLEHTGLKTLAS